MLERIVFELGPWNWMALGFALLALEIVLPGFFLLWIGIAALLTGALSLQLWDATFWTWHVQVVVFLALSLAAAYAGKKIAGGGNVETDQRPMAALECKIAGLLRKGRQGRCKIRIPPGIHLVV